MQKFKKLTQIPSIPNLVSSIKLRSEKFLPCSSKNKNQISYEKTYLKYFSNFNIARAEIYLVIVETFEKLQQIESDKREIDLIKKQLEDILSRFSFKDYQKANKHIHDETLRRIMYVELIKMKTKTESISLLKVLEENVKYSYSVSLRKSAIKILISSALEEAIFPEIERVLKVIDQKEFYLKFETLKNSQNGLELAKGNIESIIFVMRELESLLKAIAKKNKKHIRGYMFKELMSKLKVMYEYQELYVDSSYLCDVCILIHMYIEEIYLAIEE